MAAATRMPSSVSIADNEISAGKVLASRRRPASDRPAPIGRCRGSATYSARCPGCTARAASGTQNLDRLADKLLPLVAEQSLRLGVDQYDPTVGGYAHHRAGRRLQERDEHAIGEQDHFVTICILAVT